MGTIRQFDLKNYKRDIFVETGTLFGDGTAYAAEFDFKKIFSIEIDEELYHKAVARFKSDPRVEIVFGDSANKVGEICDSCAEDILFFLDAHFPGADRGDKGGIYELGDQPNISLPLKKELEAIARRTNKKDLIIIDDLRIFEDNPKIPAKSAVDHIQSLGRQNIKVRDELVHFDLFEIIFDLFPDAEIQRIYEDEGYLILTRV